LSEVQGISGSHHLFLPKSTDTLVELDEEIAVSYAIMEGAQLGGETAKGSLIKVSRKGAEARLDTAVPTFSNLKISLSGSNGREIPGVLYAKVLGTIADNPMCFSIRFTSMPAEMERLLDDLTASTQQKAAPTAGDAEV
jgi:hypothetical protein